MEKILGLDLGTHSIGWAIREVNVELENQIIDKGVLTFDKGVAEDKSGEHPMVQKRTESRSKRRNYQAEKYRKWELLKCLIENDMCPLSLDELNKWRYYQKGVGRKYPQSKNFLNWLRYDFDGDGKPDFERLGFSKHESHYLFRVLIIAGDKRNVFRKEPHIIGRVLYQMVQRRGYKDGTGVSEQEQEELSKTIMRGGGDSGASGVNEIIPYIEKYKTLGAALYYLQKEKNVRIRKRYNLRSHFEAELLEICRVQEIGHIYKQIWGSIIWQRPLRSQKGLVGLCTFEPNKRRCPISHPLYEEFQTWVFINNLKVKPIAQDVSKSESENQEQLVSVLKSEVYPLFYKSSPDFKLNSISKRLKAHGFEITAKFPDDTKVNSVSFLNKLKDVFGDEWVVRTGWADFFENRDKVVAYSFEDLWHLHFTKCDNKLTGESAATFLRRFALEKLKLDAKQAEAFANIRLQQGYATLSLSAIKKILVYLHRGFIYSEAVYLANLERVLGVSSLSTDQITKFIEEFREVVKRHSFWKKIVQISNELISDQLNSKQRFGMDSSYQLDDDDRKDVLTKITSVIGIKTWGALREDEKELISNEVSDCYLKFLQKRINSRDVFGKVGRLHEVVFEWIKDKYGVPDQNIKYLWHPSEQEAYRPAKIENGRLVLGNPEPISKGFKNPMAMKTLYRLKRLINYLISVGKIDEDTRIVVEIARELNDANRRKAIQKWQKDRESENEGYKLEIDRVNKHSGSNYNREDKNLLTKIRLWEEQKRMCMYTGKIIGLADVLSGLYFDVEHTIPASMSFDNELKNKTIADSYYNREIKQRRIPYECPNFDREFVSSGVVYSSVLSNIQAMFGRVVEIDKKVKGKIVKHTTYEKILELEELFFEWKAKTSDDKKIRDNIMIRRHLIKMELDYWRSKLSSFVSKEYQSGWRNSQLRDTQTITKYALPYLKTVFNKVDVQKGAITADFRKIYGLQSKLEAKERVKHSHHAIDAAVLTLIPQASKRDQILLNYNRAIEDRLHYHESPLNWRGFKQHFITGIEEDVLVNYLPCHRTLKRTFKKIRKRGVVQYMKTMNKGGGGKYKLDESGKKIPLFSRGDSIRGQLHEDSFFGAIKHKGELALVKRCHISSFTSIGDCKKIVDDTVRTIVREELERRVALGQSFDKAKFEPISFPNGKEVIKKVRCRVAAGRGYLTPAKAIEVQRHQFLSTRDYQHHVYAQNDQNVICLYYESVINDVILRAFRILGLFDLAKLKFKADTDFFADQYFRVLEVGKGEKRVELPLVKILKVGTKVIFFDDTIEELKEMSIRDISKRLFRVYKFNEMGTPNLYLQLHLEARKNELLGDGGTCFDPLKLNSRLKIKADKLKAAIEGRDFEVALDGQIVWLD